MTQLVEKQTTEYDRKQREIAVLLEQQKGEQQKIEQQKVELERIRKQHEAWIESEKKTMADDQLKFKMLIESANLEHKSTMKKVLFVRYNKSFGLN